MRLHSLSIQAFGPFAEKQSVDFDALAAQGLFLLNGPTGAGKSSVLDAICFALYGSLPGARQAMKRLRSDHAPAGLAPEIELEFSVGKRRFRVQRSPQWERPSKRGSGTTTEHARTLLSELVGEDWVQKSIRNDEASGELRALLGMDKEQFTRVVMLPQGEFAAFLHSDAKSRGALLQRLFSTDRFENVEAMLTEKARITASALAAAEAEQLHTLRRAVDEAARHGIASEVPDTSNADDPDFPGPVPTSGAAGDGRTGAGDEPAARKVQRLLQLLEDRCLEAHRGVQAASRTLDDGAVSLARLQSRRANAVALGRLREAQRRHDDERGGILILQSAVERHQTARLLEGELRAVQEAGEDHRSDQSAKAAAFAALLGNDLARAYVQGGEHDSLTPESRTPGQLAQACREVSAELGVLRAALPDEDRLTAIRRESADSAAEVERLRERERKALALADELQGSRTIAEDQAQVLGEAARGIENWTRELEAAAAVEEVIRDHGSAEQRRVEAEAGYAAALEEHLELKELWLSKLQIRLEQAAVELASQLVDGEACAVCGSPEHPLPAEPHGSERVTHAGEQLAREAQSAAEQRLGEVRVERDAARMETTRLAALGGAGSIDDARAATGRARHGLRAAEEASRKYEKVRADVVRLRGEEQAVAAELEQDRQGAADAAARVSSLRSQEREMSGRLEGFRGGFPSLRDRVEAVVEGQALLIGAQDAQASAARTEVRLEKAGRVLEDLLGTTIFTDGDEARAALLPSRTVEAHADTLRSYDGAGHRLSIEWEDAAVVSALADEEAGLPVPTPDEVDAATTAHEERTEEAGVAAVAAQLLHQSVSQVKAYRTLLHQQEVVAVPLREEHLLVSSVAETARGGGENAYKMSLSTYVLASRLEQVAEAATERLRAMSDGRYALVHSDAHAGNKRSGLGLNVVDEWTGNQRDTATLSGGESFMASLAMALGLADVVQQEAGGLDIETLFVDEGFGSLDDQALEQVMDALEGLRSGGRVVGLVSHVAELKQRVTAQLQVVKGRKGSSLRYVEQLQSV
ncbi:SMC family ATPase [Arthrobacter sp. Br18]|uniref:AAA family ATPase n=1 Tax=Arthrobacter sp. Br18 TaxID=1312954 RepID=UPI00047EBB58|nr:SMC family ATPase [Arthrobacter sp. Br18]